MSTPARVDVDAWHPHDMLPVAAALRTVAGSILDKSGPVRNSVVGLDRTDQWVGVGRNSADDRADAEGRWLSNLAANFDDVATAIEKGCEDIANHKSFLISLQNDAFNAGYELVSTGDVTWTLQRRQGVKSKAGDGAAMASWSQRLVAQANETFHAVQGAANSLKTELGNLTTLTPASLALNGTMGRRDAQMAKDGWTPEELRTIATHLGDAQLTPEQINALLNGQTADVPPGVISYLRNLFGGLDPGEALSLRYGLDGLSPAAGTSFANGLATLSNEHVGGGGTAGGRNELPGWAQDWLGETIPTDLGRFTPENAPALVHAYALGQLFAGATLPPGVQTGTQLTLRASNLGQAALENPNLRHGIQTYMDRALANDGGLGIHIPPGRDFETRFDDTMQSLVHAGSLNQQSMTAVLTGHGGETAGLPTDYNRDATLRSLYDYGWHDNGKTVGGITDWIDDFAGDQHNAYRAGLSAEAFHGLYDFGTDPSNFKSLMEIGGPHQPSLGEVNPLLARALENASRPYFNVLAGGDPTTYGFNPAAVEHLDLRHLDHNGNPIDIADDGDMQDRVRRLFTLISTDGDARSHLIADIGLQQTVNASHVPDAIRSGSGFDGDLAARNGWLQYFARDGIMGAQLDAWHDQHPGSDSMSPADFNSMKSNVNTLVKEGIKLLPFPGSSYAATGAGLVIDWAHPPPTQLPDQGVYPTYVNLHDTLLEQHWSAWAATSPSVDSVSPQMRGYFDAHGNLKPLADVLSPPHHDGTAPSMNTLITQLAGELRRQNLDLSSYDDTYRDTTGDERDPIDYNTYRDRLLRDK